jgi:hypothetical protein
VILKVFNKNLFVLTLSPKAGWPSWLWRQVKVYLNINLLVRETERGFKSHSCHYSFSFVAAAGGKCRSLW